MPRHCTKEAVRYQSLDFLVDEGYRVGDDGSVWSRRTFKPLRGKGRRGFVNVLTSNWKRLRPGKTGKCGHLTIALRKDGRMKSYYVHRLVLLAFVGSCLEGQECRHLDGKPANNVLNNLCWGTSKENSQDSIRHGTTPKGKPGLRGERNGMSTTTDATVREIRRMYATGKYTAVALSKVFNVSASAVYDVVARRTWRHI